MNLEERMARLEQDNRRWKRLALLSPIILFGMLTLMGANPQETMKTLTVREIIFKDETGTMRGRITADKGIAQQFYASNGKERYRLAISDTAVVEDFRDSNDVLRSRLEVDKTGNVAHELFDKNNISRLITMIDEENNAFYSLHDTKGVRFISMIDADGNTYLSQLDDQDARYLMTTFSDGNSAQLFFDRKGEIRAGTGINANNTFKHYIEKSYLEQAKEALGWFHFFRDGYDALNYLFKDTNNSSTKDSKNPPKK